MDPNERYFVKIWRPPLLAHIPTWPKRHRGQYTVDHPKVHSWTFLIYCMPSLGKVTGSIKTSMHIGQTTSSGRLFSETSGSWKRLDELADLLGGQFSFPFVKDEVTVLVDIDWLCRWASGDERLGADNWPRTSTSRAGTSATPDIWMEYSFTF